MRRIKCAASCCLGVGVKDRVGVETLRRRGKHSDFIRIEQRRNISHRRLLRSTIHNLIRNADYRIKVPDVYLGLPGE